MSARSIATVTSGLSLMSVAAEILGGGDVDVSSPPTSMIPSSEGDRRSRLDDMELHGFINNTSKASNKHHLPVERMIVVGRTTLRRWPDRRGQRGTESRVGSKVA